ncbi:FCD domain-containing protein [Antrihabitans sp. YC2-6]|uniref:FCD domain-containing protein n=1 Tax=Antrihabitans sp. YC2-6 TaxID=2799498 RepID=UPI0018F4F028|nr:FCD domain-containing protein [Antrihabitans sp. YC2-6]MBJ8348776.1 hypothetical protein [Antrihabitans sp. YC2-6]
MNLSDRRTASQSDGIGRSTNPIDLFDEWAQIAVAAAAHAAARATTEQVRSLQVLGLELSIEWDAPAWESVAEAWRAGIFEAGGDYSSDARATALWDRATSAADLPTALWSRRGPMERTIGDVVFAVERRSPAVAEHSMRDHIETLRAALFSA